MKKRGRPRSKNPLSNKERQRLYRKRHKGVTVRLTLVEARWLAQTCKYKAVRDKIIAKLDADDFDFDRQALAKSKE